MFLLYWIVLGGIAGWIASVIMRSHATQGMFTNVLLGIAGAIVGGSLFNLSGANGVTGFNTYSLLVAIVGAVVLIWLRRVMIRA